LLFFHASFARDYRGALRRRDPDKDHSGAERRDAPPARVLPAG